MDQLYLNNVKKKKKKKKKKEKKRRVLTIFQGGRGQVTYGNQVANFNNFKVLFL
jgi:hypothetical protein